MADVDGKTVMQSPDGRLYRVAPAEVETVARDQGWKVADDASVATRVKEREGFGKYGSTGQQAIGLAETAVRAATLGAIPSLTGNQQESRERANVLERESPTLATAAQIAPGAAAAIATGGAGLGLTAGIAAQGAIGGMSNLGAAQEEAFKRDERLSTEAAWGSFGSGVLLGAAAEVGGNLLAKGAGAVRNRFVEAASGAARRAETEAFEQAGIVRPAKGLAKAAEDPVAAAGLRQSANAARAEAQPELQKALAEADAAHQAVASGVPSGIDLEGAASGDIVRQRHLVRDVVIGLRDDLNKISGGARSVDAPLSLEGRTLESLNALPIEGADDLARVEALKKNSAFKRTGNVASNDGKSGITIVDDGGDLVLRDGRHRLQAAQEMGLGSIHGRYVKPGGEVIYEGKIPLRAAKAGGATADAGIAEQAMMMLDRAETQPQIYDMLLRIRGTLRSVADQTDNPAFARVLKKYGDAANDLAESKKAWGSSADSTAASNRQLQQVSEAKASLDAALSQTDYMATVGTSGGKAVDDALAAYSDRLGELLKSHGAEAEQGAQAIAKLRELADGKLRAVAAGNQIDALSSTVVPRGNPAQPSMGADLLGELGETAVESVVPGAGLVRKAWKYRRQISQLVTGARANTERTAAAMLAGASSRAAGASRAAAGASAVGSAARAAQRGAAQGHYFESIDKDPEKAYAKVKESVELLAENPDRLIEHLTAQMGDLPQEVPELHEQIVLTADRAVSFLKQHIPPAFGFSMLYPDGPPPSRTDILELSLYWQGATNKTGTESRIASGDVMPEEMEAYRAVFPEAYADLQETTCIMAQEKARKGHVLGAYQVAYLESTLQLDGQLDPTFSDTVATVYQQTDQKNIQTQQERAQGSPKPQAGERIIQKASYS